MAMTPYPINTPYCLTPYPIKAQKHVKIFTHDEIERRFTNANFNAQQLGIYIQRDWTNSMDKLKFSQLLNDAAVKFDTSR